VTPLKRLIEVELSITPLSGAFAPKEWVFGIISSLSGHYQVAICLERIGFLTWANEKP
jgi:hypothetical protein